MVVKGEQKGGEMSIWTELTGNYEYAFRIHKSKIQKHSHLRKLILQRRMSFKMQISAYFGLFIVSHLKIFFYKKRNFGIENNKNYENST